MKTALGLVILCSNRWLQIETTRRGEKRICVVRPRWTQHWSAATASIRGPGRRVRQHSETEARSGMFSFATGSDACVASFDFARGLLARSNGEFFAPLFWRRCQCELLKIHKDFSTPIDSRFRFGARFRSRCLLISPGMSTSLPPPPKIENITWNVRRDWSVFNWSRDWLHTFGSSESSYE